MTNIVTNIVTNNATSNVTENITENVTENVADKTSSSTPIDEHAAEQMARAVAKFDRVLAGEALQESTSTDLLPELDLQAGEFVTFLALVEQAWPRDKANNLDAACPTARRGLDEEETPVEGLEVRSSEALDDDGDWIQTEQSLREIEPESEPEREHRNQHADSMQLNLGRFRLLKQLGHGGYGVVYLAEDPSTRRSVALKVPRPDVIVTKELQRRFVREAQAAAALDHPSIVRIYEAGEIGLICYIASECCPGMNLAAWLTTQSKRMNQNDAARIVALLADAVHHAHCRGVLHRDIKPSNVLLEVISNDASQLFPKLCDFGLARVGQQEGNESLLTRSGEMLGTPSYMSPEQVSAKTGVLTEAVDIYALGAILYELLTGQVPFAGETTIEIMRKVMEEDPVDPREFHRDVSRELVAVCFRCLEKQPSDRYGSAAELAEDLRRFLAGEAVKAQLPSLSQRLVVWAQRNSRVAVVSAATLSVFVLSLLAVQSMNSRRLTSINSDLGRSNAMLENANAQLSTSNDALNRKESELREHLYLADMANASNAYGQYDLRTVRQLLDSHIPQPNEADLRRFHWHLLDTLAASHTKTILGKHEASAREVCVTKDGKRAYSVGHDGCILGFDLESNKLISSWKYEAQIDALAISDDDRMLLTGLAVHGTPKQTTLVLELETGREILRLKAHAYPIVSAAFSPDGKLIATGGSSSKDQLMVHSLDGELIATKRINMHSHSLSFSPDGDSITTNLQMSSPISGKVHTWSLTDKEGLRDSQTSGWIHEFAVSHSASMVAINNMNSSQVVLEPWLTNDQQFKVELPCRGNPRCVEFSPSGDLLAVGTDDGEVTIWNVQELLERDYAHMQPRVIYQESIIRSIAFVPGSMQTSLITTSEDGNVTRWTINDPNPRPVVLDLLETNDKQDSLSIAADKTELSVLDFTLSAAMNGQYFALLTDGRLGRLTIGEGAHGSFAPICQTKADSNGRLALSDTQSMVAVAEPGAIAVISLATGEILKRAEAPSEFCQAMHFRDRTVHALYDNTLWSMNLDRQNVEMTTLASRFKNSRPYGFLPIPGSESILVMSCRKAFVLEDGGVTQ